MKQTGSSLDLYLWKNRAKTFGLNLQVFLKTSFPKATTSAEPSPMNPEFNLKKLKKNKNKFYISIYLFQNIVFNKNSNVFLF